MTLDGINVRRQRDPSRWPDQWRYHDDGTTEYWQVIECEAVVQERGWHP